MADYSCKAAAGLHEILTNFNPETLPQKIGELHTIEHTADKIKHDLMEKLVKEFIPPIEREDIVELAGQIDSVTDSIEDVLLRVYMYNIKEIPAEFLTFSELIVKCCGELLKMMQEFSNFKKSTTLKGYIIEVNGVEEQGDKLYSDAVRALFTSGRDAIVIMGMNEVYNRFEKCCDACEDVADVVESVIMKNC